MKTEKLKISKKEGRPSKYKTEYCKQGEKLCLLGATDKQLANFFDISESTLNKWKKEHPQFSESLKRGKDIIDQQVVQSLFKRATGYENPNAVKIFMPANATKPVYAPFTEYYPPDPTSMIFWLKNRMKEEWRDKHDVDSVNVNFNTDDLKKAKQAAKDLLFG